MSVQEIDWSDPREKRMAAQLCAYNAKRAFVAWIKEGRSYGCYWSELAESANYAERLGRRDWTPAKLKAILQEAGR